MGADTLAHVSSQPRTDATDSAVNPDGEILLIDGFSLAFRAFFALPETITRSDGMPTNALYGLSAMTIKVIEEERPSRVIVAWDPPGPTFRDAIYPEYKAGRRATPEGFKAQVPHFRPLMEAFGAVNVEAAGFEADDVIGTLAKRAAAAGMRVTILTSDRDALQLVDDHISVLATGRGVTDTTRYDPAMVQERYGVVPGLMPDLRGMIGDSSGTLQWMLWTTPFGWTELVQPLTMNDPWPIGIGFVVAIALAALATVGAKHRDVGDGLLATSDVKQLRRFGLQSSFRFSLRLELPVVVAWCGGAAAVAVVYGIISKMTVTSVPASLNNVLDRFAVQGTFANQFFGVAFLLVAAVVALIPAGQLGAASAEETSGRLEHLLSRSTTRAGWFVGRLVICACAIVAAAVVSGVGAWFGASTQGVPVSFGSLLGAGLNVVPTALVALGIGAVVFAFAPRSAATIVYVVVIWSVLLDLLSSLVTGAAWLDRVSLFAPMALAPAQSIHASTLLITGAIGIALCTFGTLLFARRDLANR